MIPLIVISLGQWALLYYAIISVKSVWMPEVGACGVTGASSTVLNVIYFYSSFALLLYRVIWLMGCPAMSFDAIVLVLSVTGLLATNARSNIWNLLLRDGVLYFVVAFSANTVPAVRPLRASALSDRLTLALGPKRAESQPRDEHHRRCPCGRRLVRLPAGSMQEGRR